ncbi:MAG: glycerol-3-phosphate acyltransferase [Arsenophonus sp. NC-PG7-MAG3]
MILSGYSSLGAIITALLDPFYVWWFKPEFTFPVMVVSYLMLFRNHENIQRLCRGKESPI